MPVNKKRNEKREPAKKKKIFPEKPIYTPKPDDTSMSAGNLVNNPAGRTRSRRLHTKISITGNDEDGQAT